MYRRFRDVWYLTKRVKRHYAGQLFVLENIFKKGEKLKSFSARACTSLLQKYNVIT